MKATHTGTISSRLQKRLQLKLQSMSREETFAYLADTVYLERKRIHEYGNSDYEALLASAARSLKGSKESMHAALVNLTNAYVGEIHTHFSNRTYDLASKLLPSALTRLLTASHPFQMLSSDFDPASRMIVQGPIEDLKKLSKKHTLVFTPTHVSNLDSPLIGYAFQSVGLPPVLYGAGLNLFSNPLMAFFLSRLGAYTVDRRKKNQLYKDVLKAYSTAILEEGHHSLFYPGGTRSRDGRVETEVKKGLLGTAIQAWQNNVRSGSNREVLVVPCTITSSLVLEAETLIDDALADSGKARYIISDDEFSERRTMANFTRKVLNLDASIYIRFSTPLDCMGNEVNANGDSLDPLGAVIDRKEYICDKKGTVIQDQQRDTIYTKRLSAKLVEAFKKDSIVLPTHLVARAAWFTLTEKHPQLAPFQIALLAKPDRTLDTSVLLMKITSLTSQVRKLNIPHALPTSLEVLLESAYQRFSLFHNERALVQQGQKVVINAKLAYYYGNRLAHLPLENIRSTQ